MEFGCNIGLNLAALQRLYPEADIHGIEINETAAREARKRTGADIRNASILDAMPAAQQYDLTFTCGVLIHINPERLNDVYDNLFRLSRRYVLISEYYNPSPVQVTYRGHENRLFKRDFAGEMMDRHAMKLVDYGFVYRRDNIAPLDDPTWFLLEK